MSPSTAAHEAPSSVRPRIGDGYYQAFELRGRPGCYGVLGLDGLTFEAQGFPTLESAQAHAYALNERLELKPDAATLRPFMPLPPVPDVPTAIASLLAIIERPWLCDEPASGRAAQPPRVRRRRRGEPALALELEPVK